MDSEKNDLRQIILFNVIVVVIIMYFNCITGASIDDRIPMEGSVESANILGILVVCISFGLILGTMENEGKPMRDFFECLNKATMRLIGIAIW